MKYNCPAGIAANRMLADDLHGYENNSFKNYQSAVANFLRRSVKELTNQNTPTRIFQ
jgi:hypothetical protein